MKFAVTTPSAYRFGHQCFLGSGNTKTEALEDAFGPKDSWGNATRKAVKRADVFQVTDEELHNLQHQN
jgi:hypothetical protein